MDDGHPSVCLKSNIRGKKVWVAVTWISVLNWYRTSGMRGFVGRYLESLDENPSYVLGETCSSWCDWEPHLNSCRLVRFQFPFCKLWRGMASQCCIVVGNNRSTISHAGIVSHRRGVMRRWYHSHVSNVQGHRGTRPIEDNATERPRSIPDMDSAVTCGQRSLSYKVVKGTRLCVHCTRLRVIAIAYQTKLGFPTPTTHVGLSGGTFPSYRNHRNPSAASCADRGLHLQEARYVLTPPLVAFLAFEYSRSAWP